MEQKTLLRIFALIGIFVSSLVIILSIFAWIFVIIGPLSFIAFMLLLIFANTKKKSVMKKVEILFGCVIIINFFMALLFGISGKLVWDKSVVDSTSKEDGYNLYSLSRSAFVCAQIIFLLTCYMLLTFAFVDKARRRKPEFSFPVPTYPINNNNQIYVPKMEPHNPASTHDSKVDSTPMAV